MSAARTQELLREAVALHNAGRLDQARRIYDAIRAKDPRNFDAWHLAGVIALQEQRPADAVGLLSRARKLNPADRVCAMRYALALSENGDHREASDRLAKIARTHANWHEAWDNLGTITQRLGHIDEAIACHRRSVELAPDYAHGWCNLGLGLLFAGRAHEALACQERAVALDPAMAMAHHGRAMALQHLHRISEAVEVYREAIARDPGLLQARSSRLTALHYLGGMAPEALFAEHAAFGRAAAPASAPRLPTFECPPSPDRRLRVAFLSPDLRDHPVATFVEPILRHIDRERFEVLLYHDHFVVDGVSERLRSLASVWRNFAGRPDEAVARQIGTDAPDILVDLAGHTGLNRLPLFARRLAPVQVSYAGYPDTTGLTEMDYRFVDAVTDPPGSADSLATERLVRFSRSAWAYLPPRQAPAPELPGGPGVTFGCFNNPSKISDGTLAVWSAVLSRTPGSRLLIKGAGFEHPDAAAWFRSRLPGGGLDSARVELLGRTGSAAEHLSLYRRMDIALDPFPYNGTTTTCEALWMGVPVVTLKGDRHCGRVGASLLEAVGRGEWIAASADQYVEIAGRLAGDHSGRKEWRLALRDEMTRSVLLDHAGQALRFENALRQCWQDRVRTAAPAARPGPPEKSVAA